MLPGTFAECYNSKRDVHEHARHKGRAFGIGTGEKAAPPKFKATRVGTLDMVMEIEPLEDAVGYNVIWGTSAEMLYPSYLVFGGKQK